jgi:hypothetical protein
VWILILIIAFAVRGQQLKAVVHFWKVFTGKARDRAKKTTGRDPR